MSHYDSLSMDEYVRQRNRFFYWFNKAQGSSIIPDGSALLDSLMQSYHINNSLVESYLTTAREDSALFSDFKIADLRPFKNKLRQICLELVGVNQNQIVRENQALKDDMDNKVRLVIYIGLLIVLSLALRFMFQVTNSVIKPVEKLTQNLRLIGMGMINPKIDITTNNELVELTSEFNKMTERWRLYERMNVQQMLTEKQKTEALVESLTEPIIATNENDEIILMNQAAADVFDNHVYQWRDKSVPEIILNEQLVNVLQTDTAQTHAASGSDVLITIEKAGQHLYFRPRQTKIVDAQGNVQGMVTLFHDIIRFKKLDEMKSDFIATVSHEFCTPLTSLNMTVDILSQQVVGPVNDQQGELLSAAKKDCDRLIKLVRELLDLSRLESGRYIMKLEPLNLHQVMNEFIGPLNLVVNDKKILLKIYISEALPLIHGDRQQLSWVITNLINNALRYTPEHGTIRLSAAQNDGMITIQVSDTGKGIPKEALATIFEKFVQIKKSSETTPGSVGLGLAIARQVVEQHGGAIWVDSEPGIGSTFTFTLPIQRMKNG
ncbi:PAS domain-containing protein [candidate division KSB1 bacterium]|nr:PAS domain-containing protein [candidate division KSB1 bacterium]